MVFRFLDMAFWLCVSSLGKTVNVFHLKYSVVTTMPYNELLTKVSLRIH